MLSSSRGVFLDQYQRATEVNCGIWDYSEMMNPHQVLDDPSISSAAMESRMTFGVFSNKAALF